MFRRNVEPTASNMVELVSNVMNLFLFYKEVSEFSSSYNLLHYSNQIKHKSTLRFFRFQVCNRIQTIKLLLKRDDEFNDIFSDVFLIYFKNLISNYLDIKAMERWLSADGRSLGQKMSIWSQQWTK